MTRIPIPLGALIAGTSLANLPTQGIAGTEASRLPKPADVDSTGTTSVTPKESLDSNQLLERAPVPLDQEWTTELERKFLRLAEKEAVGELTEVEAARLAQLSELRYALKVPRSGEEVLNEYKRRQVVNDLLTALQRYAYFVKPPSH
jgi:hypothetical protein